MVKVIIFVLLLQPFYDSNITIQLHVLGLISVIRAFNVYGIYLIINCIKKRYLH